MPAIIPLTLIWNSRFKNTLTSINWKIDEFPAAAESRFHVDLRRKSNVRVQWDAYQLPGQLVRKGWDLPKNYHLYGRSPAVKPASPQTVSSKHVCWKWFVNWSLRFPIHSLYLRNYPYKTWMETSNFGSIYRIMVVTKLEISSYKFMSFLVKIKTIHGINWFKRLWKNFLSKFHEEWAFFSSLFLTNWKSGRFGSIFDGKRNF